MTSRRTRIKVTLYGYTRYITDLHTGRMSETAPDNPQESK